MTSERKDSTVTVTSILVHVCEPCRKGEGGKCESNLCEHWGRRKVTDEMIERAVVGLRQAHKVVVLTEDERRLIAGTVLRAALEVTDDQ